MSSTYVNYNLLYAQLALAGVRMISNNHVFVLAAAIKRSLFAGPNADSDRKWPGAPPTTRSPRAPLYS